MIPTIAFLPIRELPITTWDELMQLFVDIAVILKNFFMIKEFSSATIVSIQLEPCDLVKITHRLFLGEKGKYIEEVRSFRLPIVELPDWAKVKLNGEEEVDITEELKKELKIIL